MNHKWDKDNVCVRCGIYRTRGGYRKLQRTYSALRHGVWEDIPVYQYGTAWYYGMPHDDCNVLVKAIGFERPDCKNENQ